MQNGTGQNGKGDSPRPVDRKLYEENFDRIFGKLNKKPKKQISLAPKNKNEKPR